MPKIPGAKYSIRVENIINVVNVDEVSTPKSIKRVQSHTPISISIMINPRDIVNDIDKNTTRK